MKINCIKSGGFLGLQRSCEIETNDLDESEKKAFEKVKKESRRDENVRDTFIYYFKFQENNLEKEIVVEETCLEEEMMPFIRKVDHKLN
ncbi:protealysin inhibitor emfourin [Autumnicola psychrophila]|jgi:hypothetical protein|uniref:Uncharacterized protein n=1 Tax=Autumnicola psychrophila TaxID=3075592 RepID=A0ABU3DQ99_9FLAO|nr:protealysin inhibitor emfourin [Zunongwangia sp. F225]MDT0685895.1 hypothetical protein [Zunongwangia sp. F225]